MVDENLHIKPPSLMLNSLELVPYQYHENIGYDGSLTITARVTLEEPQYAALGSMLDSINVVRVGVDETPRKMRLNEVAWYKKNQEIKEEIQLFDEEDEIKLPPIPWLNGLSELVAKQSLIIDKLLNLLISKDIIDVDDVKDIQLNITDENVWNKRREFNRISRRDLDEYKFKD